MQLPSVDIFIGLAFLVGIAYGFILQREKVITILCSTYIGLVIASNFSQAVFEFFNGNKVIANQLWVRGNASTSTIAIILFLVCIFLVSGAINSKASKNTELSVIEVLVYSALLVALILSSVLNFLPEASRTHYIEISQACKYLYAYKTLFVLLPPIMLVFLNSKKKDKR